MTEQIAGTCASQYPDVLSGHLCHETIYLALYRGSAVGERRLYQAFPDRAAAAQAPFDAPISGGPGYVVPHQRLAHRPAVVTIPQPPWRLGGDLVAGR